MVMITRKMAVELGEQAISLWGADTDVSPPEVVAFRHVIATAPAFARGGCQTEDDACIACPMRQTRFWPVGAQEVSDLTMSLALAWDSVTYAAGLGGGFLPVAIHVNPLT